MRRKGISLPEYIVSMSLILIFYVIFFITKNKDEEIKIINFTKSFGAIDKSFLDNPTNEQRAIIQEFVDKKMFDLAEEYKGDKSKNESADKWDVESVNTRLKNLQVIEKRDDEWAIAFLRARDSARALGFVVKEYPYDYSK